MVLFALDKSVVYFDSSRSLFVSIVIVCRYEIYMPKLKTHNTATFHIQNMGGPEAQVFSSV